MQIITDAHDEPPKILDVAITAVAGTFSDKPELIKNLTAALMRWERVPSIPWFVDNTAAFVHDLEPDALGTSGGDSNYVRVEVLTPVGVLDRDKKLGAVKEMTEIVAAAAADPNLAERTWVLISEAPDGGWGIDGHAYTNVEIAETARRQITETWRWTTAI